MGFWANLLSESNCHLGEARQLSAHSHMVSLLGPVDKRSSTGTKRLYKDGIGRSQTDLMLFYRLKCLNLAQEKDYCHSTSRKLALGVVEGKMLGGWRSQVTKRGEGRDEERRPIRVAARSNTQAVAACKEADGPVPGTLWPAAYCGLHHRVVPPATNATSCVCVPLDFSSHTLRVPPIVPPGAAFSSTEPTQGFSGV